MGAASYAPRVPEAVTVLIVDDEPQLLQLLVRIFEKQGFRVFSALEPQEAWTIFQAHQREIDVVLLDVVLPPGGVTPLLSRILGLREDVGVVLTSGDQLDNSLRERLDALGGGFLYKPFSADAAYEAIAQVTAA